MLIGSISHLSISIPTSLARSRPRRRSPDPFSRGAVRCGCCTRARVRRQAGCAGHGRPSSPTPPPTDGGGARRCPTLEAVLFMLDPLSSMPRLQMRKEIWASYPSGTGNSRVTIRSTDAKLASVPDPTDMVHRSDLPQPRVFLLGRRTCEQPTGPQDRKSVV